MLASSASLQERLLELGCPESKLRLNRTGIPLDAFPRTECSAPADGSWRLVQACRLIEKKGLNDSLHAFAAFRQRYPKAHFTLAGEGPLLEETEALAQQLGVADAVTFAGFLRGPDLSALYREAHVFLHPSRMTADQNQEGVPNSMLEAMATGLPVVATFHGGIPEAVDSGQTGLLVPERDREGLRESLLELADNPARWTAMGQAAADAMANHFEASRQIERLEGFYDEAVELGSSR